MLLAWLKEDSRPRLKHCLIYDNSPTAMVDPSVLGDNITLVWQRDNGGTANAYHAAAERAVGVECDWLLLLDQDTVLPFDYLQLGQEAIDNRTDVAIVVPRVSHDGQLISPATITPMGSIVPCLDPNQARGMPTAISSGAIIQRAIIHQLVFPSAIWLDYVDHWIFLQLSKRFEKIGVIDARLAHDLSVRTPKTLSDARVASILNAETSFYAAFGGKARAILPFRRLVRAARYAAAGRLSLAALVAGGIFFGMVSPRHD
nr:glycosyltransferase [Sphingomonas faeni]